MVVITRPHEYIEHHGINGQKWGIRNGPPYPLDYGDHSHAEKSKNPSSSLNNYEKHNPKGSSSFESSSAKRSVKTGEVNNKKTNSTKNQTTSKNPGKILPLTEEEIQKRREVTKKVLIAAGVAVGIGAACYVAYKHGAVEYIRRGLVNASESGVSLDSSSLKKLCSEAADQSISDVDWSIKQGDVMHRMHAWKDFDLARTAGKGTYVTVTEADRAGYLYFLKDWHQTGERYDISLKAKKDILLPSEAKARLLFQQFYDNNPEYQKKLVETVSGAYEKLMRKPYDSLHIPLDDMTSKAIKTQALSKAMTDLKTDKFKTGMYSIVKGKEDSAMLFDMYRKAGYNAIVDYFDKGEMGDMPVILFDAQKDVVVEGSQFVTKAMKRQALDTLKKATSHPLHQFAVSR